MDPTTLAQNLVTFLAPFLPYLIKAGEKAAEEAGKKLGADAWERAKALWGRLRGKPQVESAAQDAAAMPEDPDAQAALRLQLKKLLAEDETLATELTQLMRESSQVGDSAVIQQKAGDNAIQIGQARDVDIQR